MNHTHRFFASMTVGSLLGWYFFAHNSRYPTLVVPILIMWGIYSASCFVIKFREERLISNGIDRGILVFIISYLLMAFVVGDISFMVWNWYHRAIVVAIFLYGWWFWAFLRS